MQDLISIIIPVYNVEKYLRQCLDSIVNQTYTNLEIICINDKSTDNSAEILEEFLQKDERIKVINNKENVGSAISRNYGLDIAAGKYIAFVDSDDYIDEKYIESMLNKMKQVNCDIVLNLSIYSNGVSILDNYTQMPKIQNNGDFLDCFSVINFLPVFIWSRLYKKSLLEKNHIRFSNIFSDDLFFNTIIELKTDKIFVFFGDRYHYCRHNGSMTEKAKKDKNWDLAHIKAYNSIYDYLKAHNSLDKRLKLFHYYSFFKVDTQEKFECCKNFFEKIKEDFEKNTEIYNDIEKFFFYSVLNSENISDYLSKYHKNLTVGCLRNKMQKV